MVDLAKRAAAQRRRLDAGCDELSDAPITLRPLTAADVGPEWMKGK
jgi:hypothetical protein